MCAHEGDMWDASIWSGSGEGFHLDGGRDREPYDKLYDK